MAEINQFGSVRPIQSADAKLCAQFEAMLAEAVDGTLTAKEQEAFDAHLLHCASCTEMLADAKRGAAWMEMLRHHAPEPPAAMLERIFAQTSGAPALANDSLQAEVSSGLTVGTAAGVEAGLGLGMGLGMGAGVGAATSNVLPFRKRGAGRFDLRAVGQTLLQPRLAMTAAMAFFSVALTLNLTGVRISDLRVSDLKPSSLKRSMYEANAHVVRYYNNLQIVYELESRVRDLQSSSDSDRPARPTDDGLQTKDGAAGQGSAGPEGNGSGANDDSGGKKKGQPEGQPRRRVSPGTSRREPLQDDLRVLAGISGRAPDVAKMDRLALFSTRDDLQTQEREMV